MKVDCIVCEKPTWKGCGLHIKTALQFVEIKDRCPNWMKVRSRTRTHVQCKYIY